MEYDAAMATLTRVKRLEINEGRAQRGRTQRGTLFVRTAQGVALELLPGRAHPHLDQDLAVTKNDLERQLAVDRLSLLRYLAGSTNEVPRTEVANVRAMQDRLRVYEELRARRNERHRQAWATAAEADHRAAETSRAVSEASLTDGTVGALLRERRKIEELRQAAWYDVAVRSLICVEKGRVLEPKTDLSVRLKM